MRLLLACLIFAAISLCPVPLKSQVEASPRSSKSPAQQYPRLSGLPSKELQDRINLLLERAEKQDLADRKDCLAYRLPGIRPGFSEKIKVTYLSPRILSIDIRYSDFGCSEYQNIDTLRPLTLDLQTGEPLDWKLFFTDEFLQYQEQQGSVLTKLYLHRVRPSYSCTQKLTEDDLEFDMWLDRSHGLWIKPSLPRRLAMCTEPISISFKKLRDAIRDPAVRQELLPPKR